MLSKRLQVLKLLTSESWGKQQLLMHRSTVNHVQNITQLVQTHTLTSNRCTLYYHETAVSEVGPASPDTTPGLE